MCLDLLDLCSSCLCHCAQTFRDLKAFLKKFKKANAKDDVVRVAKLEEQRPTYSLAHIVRERL